MQFQILSLGGCLNLPEVKERLYKYAGCVQGAGAILHVLLQCQSCHVRAKRQLFQLHAWFSACTGQISAD